LTIRGGAISWGKRGKMQEELSREKHVLKYTVNISRPPQIRENVMGEGRSGKANRFSLFWAAGGAL